MDSGVLVGGCRCCALLSLRAWFLIKDRWMKESRHVDEYRTSGWRMLFDTQKIRKSTARILSNFNKRLSLRACCLGKRPHPPPAATPLYPQPNSHAAVYSLCSLSNHAASFSSNGSVYVSGGYPSPNVVNFLCSGDSSRSYVIEIPSGQSSLIVQGRETQTIWERSGTHRSWRYPRLVSAGYDGRRRR